MLMLSLNNKYFIGSVYAGMLWSLGDVTEPFHVNLFDVQKKNLYNYFYAGGSGTKHECRVRERDQIRYISAGARRSLVHGSLKGFMVVRWHNCQNHHLKCLFFKSVRPAGGAHTHTHTQLSFCSVISQ